jgi:dTDP-4-dehydrorhamnose reductase
MDFSLQDEAMHSEPVGAMFERLPLLITGITGVAGFNALHYFQRRYPGQVVGIRPRKTPRLRGSGIVALDAEDQSALRQLFATHRFRSVLNCAGNCALKSCELDPAMAGVLNVATATAISENVRAFRARLVHLSTDLVFSGAGDGGYTEDDAVDPVSVYGKTMAEAESLIARTCPEAAILRISLPMGPSFNRHAGAIDWIQSRFRHSRPATLYFDEVRSCTYADDLNPVFEVFLAGDQSGLFHLGGPRPLSLYQIGQIVNRVGGFEPALLKGCPRKNAGPIPPRAGNVTMCSARLISHFGRNPLRPWPALEALVPTDRQWHRNRCDDEPGSPEQIREVLYHHAVSAGVLVGES